MKKKPSKLKAITGGNRDSKSNYISIKGRGFGGLLSAMSFNKKGLMNFTLFDDGNGNVIGARDDNDTR